MKGNRRTTTLSKAVTSPSAPPAMDASYSAAMAAKNPGYVPFGGWSSFEGLSSKRPKKVVPLFHTNMLESPPRPGVTKAAVANTGARNLYSAFASKGTAPNNQAAMARAVRNGNFKIYKEALQVIEENTARTLHVFDSNFITRLIDEGGKENVLFKSYEWDLVFGSKKTNSFYYLRSEQDVSAPRVVRVTVPLETDNDEKVVDAIMGPGFGLFVTSTHKAYLINYPLPDELSEITASHVAYIPSIRTATLFKKSLICFTGTEIIQIPILHLQPKRYETRSSQSPSFITLSPSYASAKIELDQVTFKGEAGRVVSKDGVQYDFTLQDKSTKIVLTPCREESSTPLAEAA